jgi:hypothetical protein
MKLNLSAAIILTFFSRGGNMDPHPNFWFTTYSTDWIPSLRTTGISR